MPNYASFTRRLAANVIDYTLIMLIFSIAMASIYFSQGLISDVTSTANAVGVFFNIIVSFGIVYFWRKKQGTPGKLLMRIYVVDKKTLDSISIKQAVIRSLVYIPSTIVFFLGYFWMLWQKDNQCWHDIASGTVVIHRPKETL